MKNFYENLPSFKNYQDLMINGNYQTIPENWFLILTDIKGSTLAVQKGRFRDVNMVGSMAIVSILNKIKQSVPFVFGGDGSTIAIPPEVYNEVVVEMQRCIQVSQSQFKLELRVAVIPVNKIYELGGKLEVAKYELSEKNYTAQFRGGGVDIADKLAKSPESPYNLKSSGCGAPDLTGLTCRWAPLKNDKGTILTLIIKPQNELVIPSILEKIKSITQSESLKDLSPLKLHKLKAKWPPPVHLEAKAEVRDGNYLKVYLLSLITNFLVYLFVKFDLSTKDFSMTKYKNEILSNADYKKFDDTLKLVIDCSLDKANEILNYLSDEESKNVIKFGHFKSDDAVMTCMVFSKDNNEHIHFIDGAKGGYTMAAKELKSKLSNGISVKKAS